MVTAGVTADFLNNAMEPSLLNDPDFGFSTEDDLDLETQVQESAISHAVRALEELARYKDDIQFAAEILFPDSSPAIGDFSWTIESARELWKPLELSSSDEFFKLARSPKVDLSDTHYDSLRELIDQLVSLNESEQLQSEQR